MLKLVQQAMAPSKEVLENVLNGQADEHSSYFKNVCNTICKFAFGSDTQQPNTTKETLFEAYNAITGYFHVKVYRDNESKLKSIQFGSGLIKSQTAFKLCGQFEKNQITFI